MGIIRHNTLTTELGGGLVGAAQWNETHEFLLPLSPLPGAYYNSGVTAALATTIALAANRIYLAPLTMRMLHARNMTIDRLGINVTTAGAAGTLIRVALYEGQAENGVNGIAGWPGVAIDQSPDMDAATTGQKEFTLLRQLNGERQYWVAVWASAACTVRALNASNAPLLISNGAAALSGIASLWFSQTFAGGSWPNYTNTDAATLLAAGTAAQNQNPPALTWRIA